MGTTKDSVTLGVLGIDHDHIRGMLGNMLAQGCSCSGWWTQGNPSTQEKFAADFAALPRLDSKQAMLDDPDVDMVLIAAVPGDRADLALAAMQAGKDVMVDKPGCTSLAQLAALRDCVAATGRIWSINFSERFEVPAVAKAEELVAAGAIGTVKQTLGTGPHRQGLHKRPDWFFQRERYGGILTDIGSHQIDQYLHFSGSREAEVVHALAENTTRPDVPEFQDFGEIVLNGDGGHGYIRVDWFTPDALPVWGDGRLTILGDKGYIELRKYIDIARQETGNHLYLANDKKVQYIDCADVALPYFPRLVSDVLHRTATAMRQEHCFKVMELALTAQLLAENKPQR